jgi:uncharacterized protein
MPNNSAPKSVQPSWSHFRFTNALLFSIAFLTIFDALFLGSGFLAQALAPGAPAFAFTDAGEAAGLILSVAILVRKRWFRKVGFNGKKEWRDLRVLWVLVVVAGFLLVSLGVLATSVTGQFLIALALSTVLIGFSEESAFRGVVLQSMLTPYTARKAVVMSALFFGVLHFNLLIQAGVKASLADTLVAVTFAFLTGIGLASFRLRTYTIWPLVAFHAVADLPGLVIISTIDSSNGLSVLYRLNLSTVVGEMSIGLILAAYGLFLIRDPSRHIRSD